MNIYLSWPCTVIPVLTFFWSLSVALGFLGWMSYIGLLLLRHHTQIGYTCPSEEDNLDAPFWSSDKAVRIIFSITAALMVFLLHGRQPTRKSFQSNIWLLVLLLTRLYGRRGNIYLATRQWKINIFAWNLIFGIDIILCEVVNNRQARWPPRQKKLKERIAYMIHLFY